MTRRSVTPAAAIACAHFFKRWLVDWVDSRSISIAGGPRRRKRGATIPHSIA
jgi:hypothetical protein